MAVRSPPSFFRGMGPMDDTMLEQRLANIDRGLARVEQILPTLATKMELAELRQEIHEEAKQSRHYMKILDEAHRGDIQLLAEHLVQAMRNPPKE